MPLEDNRYSVLVDKIGRQEDAFKTVLKAEHKRAEDLIAKNRLRSHGIINRVSDALRADREIVARFKKVDLDAID